MDLPECKELKAKYDSCFGEWYNSKNINLFDLNFCRDSFQDYKDCVEVTMRLKIQKSRNKEKTKSDN